MDKALALGDIAVTLPYIKKKGVEVLKASYSSSEQAAQQLPQAVTDFYKSTYPELYAQRRQDIDHAAREILDVYSRNVSPDLRVTWGTYPNNLGHMDFPGCFRCHDGAHESPDGKVINQDCDACHQTLAMEETSPAILETLGVAERISNVQKK